jgi:hypothetical protein
MTDTPDTYGLEDDLWTSTTDEPREERVDTVIVDGAAMSFRSYRRRGDETGSG